MTWRLSSHSKMLRNKPKLKYCGLTVVLSNPSRFDRVSLLSATGGHVFNDHCLRPDFNVMQCDIRVSDDKSPLLPDTKCVLLLGEGAMRSWLPETRNNSLGEMRGSVFIVNNIPHTLPHKATLYFLVLSSLSAYSAIISSLLRRNLISEKLRRAAAASGMGQKATDVKLMSVEETLCCCC